MKKNGVIYLIAISFFLTVYIVVEYGIHIPEMVFFHFPKLMKEGIGGTPDIYIKFLENGIPLFFHVFNKILDIPLSYVLVGFLVKFLIFLIYYMMVYAVFKRHEIAVISMAIMLWMPLAMMGSASIEIRDALSFSARQFGTLFQVLSIFLFLSRRYLLASIVIGAAINSHPLNSIMLYGTSILVLSAYSYMKRGEEKAGYKSLLAYVLPALCLIAFYVARNLMFARDLSIGLTEMISSLQWWNASIMNEPDDVSITWRFTGLSSVYYAVILFYSAVALAVLRVNSKYRKWEVISRDYNKRFSLFILTPWAIAFAALAYEVFLLPYMPDFINDQFIPLQFRRITYIPALFYMPVIACGIHQTISITIDKLKARPEGGKYLQLLLNEKLLIAVVIALMFTVHYVAKHEEYFRAKNFIKYLDREHRPYTFFADEDKYDDLTALGIAPHYFLSAAEWIKKNVPADDKLFTPPYLKEAILSDHQWFLSEKMNGNFMFYSRKYSSVYLERFQDLLGISYDDFPTPVFEGGEPYRIIRQRYLRLTEDDFIRLNAKYPDYTHILTESSHKLDFPVLYENMKFILYKIEKPSF